MKKSTTLVLSIVLAASLIGCNINKKVSTGDTADNERKEAVIADEEKGKANDSSDKTNLSNPTSDETNSADTTSEEDSDEDEESHYLIGRELYGHTLYIRDGDAVAPIDGFKLDKDAAVKIASAAMDAYYGKGWSDRMKHYTLPMPGLAEFYAIAFYNPSNTLTDYIVIINAIDAKISDIFTYTWRDEENGVK